MTKLKLDSKCRDYIVQIETIGTKVKFESNYKGEK